MGKGGARLRSGPRKQEGSRRSMKTGWKLDALPFEGYDGPLPPFPLPRLAKDDEDAEMETWVREQEVWQKMWRTPQACAWAMQPWRIHTVGLYVRTLVICEGPNASAADKNSLHRFADQVGMTTAGLAEMGWKIALRPESDTDDEDEAVAESERTGTDGVVTSFERRR